MIRAVSPISALVRRTASLLRWGVALLLLVHIAGAQPPIEGDGTAQAIPHTVIVRIRDGGTNPTERAAQALASVRDRYGITSIRSWLLPALLDTGSTTGLGKSTVAHGLAALRQIMVVEYTADERPEAVAEKIATLPDVNYAEPQFKRSIQFTPNDPLIAQQWYLERIAAPGGWDLTRADSSIIIAIVDTGIELTHPDLRGAILHNPGEEGTDPFGRDRGSNGVDDDGNGLIDDRIGYDFAGTDGSSDDNDPTGVHWHGTHVAGIAAASGNNGTGIVGVGYGARILAVKIATDESGSDPLLVHAYDGILYAARMGARIINCSWGGAGRSRAEQEVIDQVGTMGSLVVASAGNLGSEVSLYPASYSGVLSVASVRGTDGRSTFSNYNPEVGISAPGEGIYSTMPTSTGSLYGYSDGTSMAAPMVSGGAALVATRYPGLRPEQISAVLRANSDDIDSLNPAYRFLLGQGRLNVERALSTGPNVVAADLPRYEIVDGNGDGLIEPGESVEIFMTLRNDLAPAGDLSVSLSTPGDSLIVEPSEITVGSMKSGETRAISDEQFRLTAPTGVPLDFRLPLLLTIADSGRTIGSRQIAIVVNPNFASTSTGTLSTTFTGNGRIGYGDFPNNTIGEGFHLDTTESFLAEGGLMIGVSGERLADVVRSENGIVQSNGLQTVLPYRVAYSSDLGAEEGTATFDDAQLPAEQRVGIEVGLTTYAFRSPGPDRQILTSYRIRNRSGGTLSDLYCGLYLDWDIGPAGEDNLTTLDRENRMGVTQSLRAENSPVVAAMLVGDQPMNFFALDNGQAPLSNGFTRSEKWESMSGGIRRDRSERGDCSMIIGAGPITLEADADTTITFSLMVGSDQEDLKKIAAEVRETYRQLGGSPGGPIAATPGSSLRVGGPNPFTDRIEIEFVLESEGTATLDVTNVLGERVALLADGHQFGGTHRVSFAPHDLGSGMYFVRLATGGRTLSEKIVRIGTP